jgi:hypothetical protein
MKYFQINLLALVIFSFSTNSSKNQEFDLYSSIKRTSNSTNCEGNACNDISIDFTTEVHIWGGQPANIAMTIITNLSSKIIVISYRSYFGINCSEWSQLTLKPNSKEKLGGPKCLPILANYQ